MQLPKQFLIFNCKEKKNYHGIWFMRNNHISLNVKKNYINESKQNIQTCAFFCQEMPYSMVTIKNISEPYLQAS